MYVRQIETSKDFCKLLKERGYSIEAIAEIWKGYDYSKKKGLASY